MPSASTSQATTEPQGTVATESTTVSPAGGDPKSAVPIVAIPVWTLRVVAVVGFAKSCGSYLWQDLKLLKVPSNSTWSNCYSWGTKEAAARIVSLGTVRAIPKVNVTALRASLYSDLKPVFGKAVTWNRLKVQVNRKTLADLTSVIGDIVGTFTTDVDSGIKNACKANGVPVK